MICAYLNLSIRGGYQALPTVLGASTILMDGTSFNKVEIEEIVAMIRLNRYNRGCTHGANAILQEMEPMGVRPLPSLRTIARILTRFGLSNGRTGHYP
jgi:hypothetical protein